MSNMPDKTSVLSPSAGSFALCLFGSFWLLAVVILSKLGSNELVNLFLGGDASNALVKYSQTSFGSRLSEILSNDLLGRTTVFAVWLALGLVVWTIMEAVIGFVTNLGRVGAELDYVHQNRASLLKATALKFGYQLGVALCWVAYTAIFIQFVLPFAFSAVYVVLAGGASVTDWISAVFATFVLFISLHFHVVLARLFAGRVRLWNNQNVVE